MDFILRRLDGIQETLLQTAQQERKQRVFPLAGEIVGQGFVGTTYIRGNISKTQLTIFKRSIERQIKTLGAGTMNSDSVKDTIKVMVKADSEIALLDFIPSQFDLYFDEAWKLITFADIFS